MSQAKSTPDEHDTCHSKPTSLLTEEEDWDHRLSTKDVHENVQIKQSSSTSGLDIQQQLPCMTPSNTCQQGLGSLQSSPNKKKVDAKQHSTPSSPSELRRLTRPEAVFDGKIIQEAKQFECELREWINQDHSPFEEES